jgi:Domain of unknown function (DUF4307)
MLPSLRGGTTGARNNGTVPTGPPSTLSAADAERIRLRYPRALIPRPVLVALIGLILLVGGTWLLWVASVRANPPVSARISAYTVQSDTRVTATLTVDRADPTRPVACRVMAQATDFQPVGEEVVEVRGTADQVVNVRVDLTTLRRATTAVVRECFVI